MKTPDLSRTQQFPKLLLYLDDIEAIYLYMKGQTGEEVALTTCGFSDLTSIDELCRLGQESTCSLKLESGPKMSVLRICVDLDANSTFVRVFGEKSENEKLGIETSIERLLLRNQTRQNPSNCLLTFVFAFFILLASFGPILFPSVETMLSIIGWVAVLICFYVAFQRINEPKNQIVFKHRKEVKSFWARNRDQIAMLFIGTIIGVAGTLLTQWCQSTFFQPTSRTADPQMQAKE